MTLLAESELERVDPPFSSESHGVARSNVPVFFKQNQWANDRRWSLCCGNSPTPVLFTLEARSHDLGKARKELCTIKLNFIFYAEIYSRAIFKETRFIDHRCSENLSAAKRQGDGLRQSQPPQAAKPANLQPPTLCPPGPKSNRQLICGCPMQNGPQWSTHSSTHSSKQSVLYLSSWRRRAWYIASKQKLRTIPDPSHDNYALIKEWLGSLQYITGGCTCSIVVSGQPRET